MEWGDVHYRAFRFVRRVFHDLGAITPGLNYSSACFSSKSFELFRVAFSLFLSVTGSGREE